MFKLKPKVMDFLKVTVKPEKLDKVVNKILNEYVKEDFITEYPIVRFTILESESISGLAISSSVDHEEVEKVEPLKPYVWYDREKWDGNPNKLDVIELSKECIDVYSEYPNINYDTTHFMYIKRP